MESGRSSRWRRSPADDAYAVGGGQWRVRFEETRERLDAEVNEKRDLREQMRTLRREVQKIQEDHRRQARELEALKSAKGSRTKDQRAWSRQSSPMSPVSRGSTSSQSRDSRLREEASSLREENTDLHARLREKVRAAAFEADRAAQFRVQSEEFADQIAVLERKVALLERESRVLKGADHRNRLQTARAERSLKEAVTRADKLQSLASKIRTQSLSSEDGVAEIEMRNVTLEQENIALTSEIATLKENATANEAELSTLRIAISELETKLSESVVPDESRDQSTLSADLLKNVQEENSVLRDRAEQAESQLSRTMDSHADDISSLKEQNRKTRALLKKLKTEKLVVAEESDRRCAELELQRSELEEKCSELEHEAERGRLGSTGQLERLRKELARAKDSCETATAAKSDACRQSSRLREEIDSLNIRVAQAERAEANATSSLERIRTESDLIKKAEEERISLLIASHQDETESVSSQLQQEISRMRKGHADDVSLLNSTVESLKRECSKARESLSAAEEQLSSSSRAQAAAVRQAAETDASLQRQRNETATVRQALSALQSEFEKQSSLFESEREALSMAVSERDREIAVSKQTIAKLEIDVSSEKEALGEALKRMGDHAKEAEIRLRVQNTAIEERNRVLEESLSSSKASLLVAEETISTLRREFVSEKAILEAELVSVKSESDGLRAESRELSSTLSRVRADAADRAAADAAARERAQRLAQAESGKATQALTMAMSAMEEETRVLSRDLSAANSELESARTTIDGLEESVQRKSAENDVLRRARDDSKALVARMESQQESDRQNVADEQRRLQGRFLELKNAHDVAIAQLTSDHRKEIESLSRELVHEQELRAHGEDTFASECEGLELSQDRMRIEYENSIESIARELADAKRSHVQLVESAEKERDRLAQRAEHLSVSLTEREHECTSLREEKEDIERSQRERISEMERSSGATNFAYEEERKRWVEREETLVGRLRAQESVVMDLKAECATLKEQARAEHLERSELADTGERRGREQEEDRARIRALERTVSERTERNRALESRVSDMDASQQSLRHERDEVRTEIASLRRREERQRNGEREDRLHWENEREALEQSVREAIEARERTENVERAERVEQATERVAVLERSLQRTEGELKREQRNAQRTQSRLDDAIADLSAARDAVVRARAEKTEMTDTHVAAVAELRETLRELERSAAERLTEAMTSAQSEMARMRATLVVETDGRAASERARQSEAKQAKEALERAQDAERAALKAQSAAETRYGEAEERLNDLNSELGRLRTRSSSTRASEAERTLADRQRWESEVRTLSDRLHATEEANREREAEHNRERAAIERKLATVSAERDELAHTIVLEQEERDEVARSVGEREQELREVANYASERAEQLMQEMNAVERVARRLENEKDAIAADKERLIVRLAAEEERKSSERRDRDRERSENELSRELLQNQLREVEEREKSALGEVKNEREERERVEERLREAEERARKERRDREESEEKAERERQKLENREERHAREMERERERLNAEIDALNERLMEREKKEETGEREEAEKKREREREEGNRLREIQEREEREKREREEREESEKRLKREREREEREERDREESERLREREERLREREERLRELERAQEEKRNREERAREREVRQRKELEAREREERERTRAREEREANEREKSLKNREDRLKALERERIAERRTFEQEKVERAERLQEREERMNDVERELGENEVVGGVERGATDSEVGVLGKRAAEPEAVPLREVEPMERFAAAGAKQVLGHDGDGSSSIFDNLQVSGAPRLASLTATRVGRRGRRAGSFATVAASSVVSEPATERAEPSEEERARKKAEVLSAAGAMTGATGLAAAVGGADMMSLRKGLKKQDPKKKGVAATPLGDPANPKEALSRLRKSKAASASAVAPEGTVPDVLRSETSLWRITGKRRMVSFRVPCAVSSLNRQDVFLLVSPSDLYRWEGSGAGRMKRAKAHDMSERLRAERGARRPIHIVSEETPDRSFWSALNGSPSDASSVSSSAPELGGSSRDQADGFEKRYLKTVSLVEVSPPEGGDSDGPSVSSVSVKQESLCEDGVYVLESEGVGEMAILEVYVWNGKRSALAARSAGMAHARSISPQSSSSVVHFARETQGGESVPFQEKFAPWSPAFAHPKRGRSSIATVSKKSFRFTPVASDVQREAKQKKLSEEVSIPALVADQMPAAVGSIPEQDADSGKVEVFVCHGARDSAGKELIPESEHGHFFSKNAYIIVYSFTDREGDRDRYTLFYWLGSECPRTESGTASMLVVREDAARGREAIDKERIEQGHEPLLFLKIFKGAMVIHKGSRTEWDKSLRACYVVRELQLGSLDDDEGDASPVSTIYGDRSEREAAAARARQRAAAMSWATQAIELDPSTPANWSRSISPACGVVVVEKDEQQCWVAPGASDLIARAVEAVAGAVVPADAANCVPLDIASLGDGPWTKSPPEAPSRPRMYVCCDLGRFEMEERIFCNADDLIPSVCVLLDIPSVETPHRELWLWVGAEAKDSLQKRSMEATKSYASEIKDPVRMLYCSSGAENAHFKAFFPDWEYVRQRMTAATSSSLDSSSSGRFSEPQDLATVLRRFDRTIPLELLQKRPLPDRVDAKKLETYLNNEEFKSVFGMDRETFYATIPQWKQLQLKKRVDLY